ncbi:hypothetical protein [Flavobacterium sp.]|uniref:hypothetical protein n=1 Tax=Flavobacterium sp. TaxID=239 RepID=UPI003F6A00EB
MKITLLLFTLLFSYTIHSQILENWKNFELDSEWSINYIENDTINETSNNIGELILKNKYYSLTVKFNVFKCKPESKTESNKILKSIIFEENPDVIDEFYFKNNFYKLILTDHLLFQYKKYNTLVTEIQNYIK